MHFFPLIFEISLPIEVFLILKSVFKVKNRHSTTQKSTFHYPREFISRFYYPKIEISLPIETFLILKSVFKVKNRHSTTQISTFHYPREFISRFYYPKIDISLPIQSTFYYPDLRDSTPQKRSVFKS